MNRLIPTALAVVLVLGGLGLWAPGTDAAYVNASGHLIEDFENVTFPAQPQSPYYTYAVDSSGGAGSAVIASAGVPSGSPTPYSGSQMLRVVGTSTTVGQVFRVKFALGTDLCDADSTGPGGRRYIDFSYYFVGTSGAASVAITRPDAVDFASVSLSPTGGTSLSLNTNSGSAGGGGVSTAANGNWNRIGFTCKADVSPSQLIVVNYDTGLSATHSVAGTFSGATELWISSQTLTGGQLPAALYVDRINFGMAPAITAETPAGPEITVVGLTGFDVDRSGTTAILRTHDADGNTQDNVRTYDAQTLSTPGNVFDTDCNRLRGVAALANNVAFLECDSGDETDVDFLMIRSNSLTDPDFPAVCTQGIPFCDKDLDANELAGCQGTANSEDAGAENCGAGTSQFDIVTIDELPFDYSAICDADGNFFNGGEDASRLDGVTCGTRDAVYFAFGASFEDGYVGVITYAMNRAADDKSQISRVKVGPNQSLVDQVCVVQDSDGTSYMYAAEGNSQMKGYRLDFSVNAGSTVTASSLAVNIVQVFPGTAQTSGATGVACGEKKFATIQPSGNLCVFARGAGSPLFCRSVSGVPPAGVAMSGNGDYVSWVENTKMRVGCAKVGGCPATAGRGAVAIGAVVAESDLPTGAFQAMKMDANANSVWVATSVRVRHYNQVFELTSGNATACLPGDVGCGPTPTGGPSATGGPGRPSAGNNGLLGVSARDSILGGLAVTLGVGILGYGMTRRKEG